MYFLLMVRYNFVMNVKQKTLKKLKNKKVIALVVALLIAAVVAGVFFWQKNQQEQEAKKQQDQAIEQSQKLPVPTEENKRILAALESTTATFEGFDLQNGTLTIKNSSGEVVSMRLSDDVLVTKGVQADKVQLKDLKVGQLIQVGYDTDYKEVRTVWYVDEN